jgi:hypothetical protein
MGCSGSQVKGSRNKKFDSLKPGERPVTIKYEVNAQDEYMREPNTVELLDHIKTHQGLRFPVFDTSSVIKLHSKREGDCLLLESLTDQKSLKRSKKSKTFQCVKFPNYKKLSLYNAEMIPSNTLHKFFSSCSPNSLETFYFHFEGNVNSIAPALFHTITSVTSDVYLSGCHIDQKSLRLIVES